MPDGYSVFRLNYPPPAPKDSQPVRAQMEQCMAVIGTETQARRDGTEPMLAANAQVSKPDLYFGDVLIIFIFPLQERAPSGNSQPSQSELCKTTSTEVTAAKQASEIPSFINKSYRRDTPYLRARRNNAKRRKLILSFWYSNTLTRNREKTRAQSSKRRAQSPTRRIESPTRRQQPILSGVSGIRFSTRVS